MIHGTTIPDYIKTKSVNKKKEEKQNEGRLGTFVTKISSGGK